MEKYGFEPEMTKEAEASEKTVCPQCGAAYAEAGTLVVCPNCGCEPVEKKAEK